MSENSRIRYYLLIINSDLEKKILAQINPKKCCVITLGRQRGSKSLTTLYKMMKLTGYIKPDVIHHHMHDSIALTYLSKYIFRHLNFLTFHFVPRPQDRLIYLKYFDHVISISNVVYETIKSLTSFRVKGHSVVYNGVQSYDQNLSHQPDEKSITVCCIGRLNHKQKGQHHLIRAIKILDEKYNKIVNLWLVGDGQSKDLLMNIATDNQVLSRTTFWGSKTQSEILSLMKEVDIIVQPSIEEGFGLSAIEGISFNKPLILSNILAFKEIVFPGNYPIFFQVGNENSLAQKINQSIDDILKESWDSTCRLYNLEKYGKYSITKTIEGYDKLYHLYR